MPHGLPYLRQRGFVDQFLDRRDTRRRRTVAIARGACRTPPPSGTEIEPSVCGFINGAESSDPPTQSDVHHSTLGQHAFFDQLPTLTYQHRMVGHRRARHIKPWTAARVPSRTVYPTSASAPSLISGLSLSLRDLSPLIDVQRDHLLVVLKSYFDGGNQADSLQYDLVTLAAFSGTKYHWQKFDRRWKKCLNDHGAKYLHTTDAVCLSRDFSRRNGWDEDKVDSLISECVSAIEECAAVRNGRRLEKAGIRPVTISVLLQDFKKALSEMPDLRTPEHLCATQCVPVCALYGKLIGADKLRLFFDQGERFFGHIRDRMDNKKSRVEPYGPVSSTQVNPICVLCQRCKQQIYWHGPSITPTRTKPFLINGNKGFWI